MSNFNKLSAILENKIPSVSLLSDYQSIENFTLCNRDNKTSIVCSLSHDEFFQFLNKNNLAGVQALYHCFDEIKDIAFDLDSLFSEQYRIYLPLKSLKMYSLWNNAKRYSLETIELEKVYHHVKMNIEHVKLRNRYEQWLKMVELADINYPIVVLEDLLGSYSVIDGVHRIQKLKEQNKQTIQAYVIPSSEYKDIRENRMNFCLTDEKFIGGKSASLFEKIKEKLAEENISSAGKNTIDNLEYIAFYFNIKTNNFDIWKFYFRHLIDPNKLFHYKFDSTGNCKGMFVENTFPGEKLFYDELNVVDELKKNNFQLSSALRTDVEQSYLGIRI